VRICCLVVRAELILCLFLFAAVLSAGASVAIGAGASLKLPGCAASAAGCALTINTGCVLSGSGGGGSLEIGSRGANASVLTRGTVSFSQLRVNLLFGTLEVSNSSVSVTGAGSQWLWGQTVISDPGNTAITFSQGAALIVQPDPAAGSPTRVLTSTSIVIAAGATLDTAAAGFGSGPATSLRLEDGASLLIRGGTATFNGATRVFAAANSGARSAVAVSGEACSNAAPRWRPCSFAFTLLCSWRHSERVRCGFVRRQRCSRCSNCGLGFRQRRECKRSLPAHGWQLHK
jgi:hypothetical protein